MKGLLLLLVLLAAAAVAWVYVTPPRTVDSLYDAVRARDTERIDRIVDFEELRENLKTDLHAVTEQRSAESDHPLASVGAAIGNAFIDGLVDTFVSPSGLAMLLSGNLPTSETTAGTPPEDPEYDIDRHGFGRFDARVRSETSSTPILEFDRQGLRWQLVRIRLDPDRSR